MLHVRTYTIRANQEQGLPAETWRAESWFTGRVWLVNLDRNGHPFAAEIDPDDVPAAIRLPGGRAAKLAARIARKLLSAS